MSSFFEKLKGSMSLEEGLEEKQEEEPKPKKTRAPRQKQETVKKIKVAGETSVKKEGPEERSPMDQWFEDGELTVDVYQTADDVVVQSAVAGVRPEDLDIAIENDMVTIKGERQNLVKEEKKNYIHQECFWGSFSRQIILPEEVDSNRAEASFQDGVLTLRLPKINRQKVKKIKLS
ncbi:MAG: Hsp20/alpha crystallin family protein [bacterium]|nr:Hsp20/alpha crystallin family protein [bacterium]